MGNRKSMLPVLPPVVQFTVAPHRYLYTEEQGAQALKYDPSYREVIDLAPYQPGEVVYVVDGDGYRRAYIVRVTCERDRHDFRREGYYVRPETKAGLWSKRQYIAHPGYIQRGYQRAGLAPEMPV